jgi:hypothetical protein
MEISQLTLKLIFLLIPGAIAAIIFEKLTTHKKWNTFQFIAHSILFGCLSYLLEYIPGYRGGEVNIGDFWKKITGDNIPFKAITIAIPLSLIVGYIAAGIDHFKVINKIGKWFHLSHKYGDESLYYFFLNSKNVTEVYIKDIAKNITYHGVIDSYSETEKISEIVLRSVNVYQYDSSELKYSLDKLYLSKKKDDLIIEVPYLNEKND